MFWFAMALALPLFLAGVIGGVICASFLSHNAGPWTMHGRVGVVFVSRWAVIYLAGFTMSARIAAGLLTRRAENEIRSLSSGAIIAVATCTAVGFAAFFNTTFSTHNWIDALVVHAFATAYVYALVIINRNIY